MESENIFCPKCGSKQQGNTFCSKCGNQLTGNELKKEPDNSHIEKTETYFFNNRIDFKETKDIGTVTHFNGKPFTGIGFRLYDNGEFKSEVPMINGLAHGISKFYNEKGEVVETVLFEKDKEIEGNQGEIDKLFKELKKKKITVKELESLYNNNKISLDELSEKRNGIKNLKASENIHIPKKPSKNSSNNTKYKWGAFIFPALATFIFLNSGIFIVLFIAVFSAGFCLLLAAVLTFLTNKRESLWKFAFVLSVFASFILVFSGLAKMNMENPFFN